MYYLTQILPISHSLAGLEIAKST